MIKLFIVLMNGVLKVDFGDELKRIRESRGMTVNQLAMYSDVSSATISRVENKKRGIPRPKYIRRLADALKYPYDDLMALAGYSDTSKQGTYIEETETDKLRKIAAGLLQKISTEEDLKKAIDHLDYLESKKNSVTERK